MKNTFYFNTGVRPEKIQGFPYQYHEEIGNAIRGTLCIPFECEAPENANFLFACDIPDLPESKNENVKVFKITGGNLLSDYAYFTINK